ncbi:MAG: beta-eliminating lyase-related protein [Muribaculum sp.]|nr:beta-eliminating lyase-related protein [Muribaculaceae bacterium]MCM1081813.1 beta-eliminating lyase-related protein [Muribaculum sp.]
MMNFNSDYIRGCHPEVLTALCSTNMDATVGYGEDGYTTEAKKLITDVCGLNEHDSLVQFLVGGTQTNAVVIDTLLRSYEGVLAAETSHINVHEAGAIEADGHKVIVLPSFLGKLEADDIASYVDNFYADDTFAHMVAPGMVYISQPTELGTLYSLSELKAISLVCHERGLKLYLDGARLAYALQATDNDVTLADISRLTDVFYIGGTKCGLLFGEAVVTKDKTMLPHFMTIVKQHGALLAKGRLLGVQFATLFRNDLYKRIGRNGISCAIKLRKVFEEFGYECYIDSTTNQQFFLLPNRLIDYLFSERVGFELWGARQNENTPVRFVTDWSTTDASIEELRIRLKKFTSSDS